MIKACKKEATDCVPRVIELAEEFVDDKVDVDMSQFPQLTLVSHEKMYYPPSAPMI
jgi:hypothetical protein